METMKLFDNQKYGKAIIFDGAGYVKMKDSLKSSVKDETIVVSNDALRADMLDASKNNDAIKISDSGVTNMGSYLEYQLTYVTPNILLRKFPEQPALELFSVSNEGAMEKVILQRMKNFSGKHTREHENKTNNKGVITVAYTANGMRVEDFGATSNYKERDLLRAARLNDPLDASLMEAHDQSYKTTINDIAFLGMTDEKGNTLVEGLLNNSQVNSAISLNASYVFTSSSATGYVIYEDIAALWRAMCALAGGNSSLFPDTIVCSPRVLAKLLTTTYGTGALGATAVNNIATVGQMIKSLLGITEIRSCVQASNLDGSGTTDRLCMFKRSADEMILRIPRPLTFSEVYKRGFSYEFESQFFVAGLNIYRDTSFGYLKGC